MSDNTIVTIDAVPEADLAEQSIAAYPNDDELEPELPIAADREAAEADVLEQSIAVPYEDDYAEPTDY
ncbi:hypothetical protein KO481_04890 [Nocardia sp. NEAU-G5]|uniref:Uncharacterized protein n=1 Tax=Nocardia albiluteola TaxID=2842303 RepID=A0ABS6AS64_9NOCA|nr:hypothetical protein [Nocardia albiluteola]MBU3060862.1 hypothetical protein [Nocardia albiluteola]